MRGGSPLSLHQLAARIKRGSARSMGRVALADDFNFEHS